MQRTPFATLRPARIFAAARRSSMRPFVQEPITLCWIAMGSIWATSSIVLVFSGRCGNATVGRSVERSMVTVESYSASHPR